MSYDIDQVNSIYSDLTDKIQTDLDNQFNKGRLSGSDYATVYAQLMQQALQLAYQSPLNEAQVKEINSRTNKTNNDINISNLQSAKDLKLKDAQINEIKERINLTREQEILTQKQQKEIDNNIDIRTKQSDKDLVVKDANIKLSDSNKNKVDYETNYILPSQKSKIDAETSDMIYLTSYIRPIERDINVNKNKDLIEQIKLNRLQQDLILTQMNEINSKIALTNTQSEEIKYTTCAIKPAEREYIISQIANNIGNLEATDSKITETQLQTDLISEEVKKLRYGNRNIKDI